MTTCNFGVSGATSEEIGIMQGAIEADDEDERLFIDEEVAELAKQHTGTILVLEMGSNGGWDGDYATLIEQYHAIIENSGCENFIIIGDTDDPGTSFGESKSRGFRAGRDRPSNRVGGRADRRIRRPLYQHAPVSHR